MFCCTFICTPAAPSSPPVEFVATAESSRSIRLSWNPPALEHQNGILRQYIVTLVSVGSGEPITRSAEGTDTTIAGLRPFTTYFCTVAAVTVAVGPETETLQVTTDEDGK